MENVKIMKSEAHKFQSNSFAYNEGVRLLSGFLVVLLTSSQP